MNIDFQIGHLESKSDWIVLARLLRGDRHRVVKRLIHHLMNLGVVSYLRESKYIDWDYSADYRAFYAQTFKTYNRHCERFHFFAEDIDPILGNPSWSEKVAALQATSRRSYRGFCVLRPLPGAPIGRTVLHATGPAEAGLESVVTCRAKFRANVLGAELDVFGTAFLQQDSRVGACAQVAIWTGARHMHQRYGYNRLSVVDITKLAAPSTADESTSLPAGSDFLTSERMIRAISEMGFQPLCLEGPNIAAKILPYVQSGLPVILGLQEGRELGHAITVIGRVFAQPKQPTKNAIDYIGAFIVHDDQAGPYMLVPMSSSSATDFNFDKNQLVSLNVQGKPVDFNMEKHAVFAIALMPMRVFSTAAEAERTSLRRFEAAMTNIKNIKKTVSKKGASANERLLNELEEAFKKDKIIVRTYLTSSSGYRRHIARSTACDELKEEVLHLHLPHFAWVTEIATVGSYNHASPSMRRIYGHALLDATSTGKDEAGVLVLHLPGLLFKRNVDAREGEQADIGIVISNDTLYEGREKRFDH